MNQAPPSDSDNDLFSKPFVSPKSINNLEEGEKEGYKKSKVSVFFQKYLLIIVLAILLLISILINIILFVKPTSQDNDLKKELKEIKEELKIKDNQIKEKDNTINEKNAKIEELIAPKMNYISLKYEIKNKDNSTLLFNNNETKLSPEDYSIEIDGKIISTNVYQFPSNGIYTTIINIKKELTTLSCFFQDCTRLIEVDLSHLKTDLVTDTTWMFRRAFSLKSINFGNFNTSSVKNMTGMFCQARLISYLNLNSFNTSQVKAMGGMFYELRNIQVLDLSMFDTTLVTTMDSMFYSLTNIKFIDITNFNINDETIITKLVYGIKKTANVTIAVNSGKQQQIIDFIKKEGYSWIIVDSAK